MSYAGDYAAGDTVTLKFTTRRFSTGAPFALAGTPAVSVYKGGSTTQSTAGVTLTTDFDTVTGLNHVAIDTTADGTFYADGSQFDVVITAGTVDSVSVVGEVVGRFTLRAQASLYPTTAGRTLDVTATGAAGIDWGNVENPTTTVGLSGTTVATVTTTTTATNVTTVNGLAANVITAAAVADGAIDRAALAADTGLQSVRSGTAQAGAAGTVTLDASASATADFYKHASVYLTGGTGAGQHRQITAYDGTTKVATVAPDWATAPDNTTTFAVLPRGLADVAAVYGSANAAINASTVYDLDFAQNYDTANNHWEVDAISIGGSTANAGSLGDFASEYAGGTVTMNITGNLSGSVGSVTGAVGSVTGAVGSVTGAVGSVTGAVGSVTGNVGGNVAGSVGSVAGGINTAAGTITTLDALDTAQDTQHATTQTAIADVPTNAELTTALNTLLTTAMTESYNADGAAPTPAQALFVIMQMLTEMSIAGTTMTVKKLDGATTAFTLTLNDATTPTSVTRAT